MFNRVGIEVTNWIEYETEDGRMNVNIRFGTDETEKLFNYMGEPLPGFENKWPEV